MLENLLAVPEETWSAFQFARDPLRKKISEEDQRKMGREAIICGRDAAKKLRKQFPGQNVMEILQALDVPVNHQNDEHIGNRLLFALYDSSRGILLMDKPLEKFAELPEQTFFSRDMVENLILSHELFHHLESHDDTMYTQKTKIVLWQLLGYKYRSNVRSLSEIAAMSFAKTLNQIGYSPFLLDILLVWPYDHDQASEMYQELLTYQS